MNIFVIMRAGSSSRSLLLLTANMILVVTSAFILTVAAQVDSRLEDSCNDSLSDECYLPVPAAGDTLLQHTKRTISNHVPKDDAEVLPEVPPEWYEQLRTDQFPHVQSLSMADALAPSLIFDETRGAFVCKSAPHGGGAVQAGVQKMLNTLETAGVPMIATAGTLLAVIRDCMLTNGDIDFMTFRRFVHNKTGQDKIDSAMNLLKTKQSHRWGTEYSFTLDGGRVDIFVAEEIKNPDGSLGYARFLGGNPTKGDSRIAMCFVPGVTEFAPVEIGDGEGRVRFLVPKNSHLTLEWMYGPKWRHPFQESHPHHKWHYWFSQKRYPQHCNVSDGALWSWEKVNQLLLNHSELPEWDASLANALSMRSH
eukprot:gnl/TRDRNA2_/TRDRNA2_125317_c0_seq1.p1 gnl/TRDRNA2_/TRDRNA2_125317_c0~~gnl/TRDRNA2_/TRDRNA2_125317_c0_seq1.p1  ORF type:complete len:365 (-),score=24.73 gnl/TRDRNA2_/TRDRNA2_125317_c0_seq1:351-1445(-)